MKGEYFQFLDQITKFYFDKLIQKEGFDGLYSYEIFKFILLFRYIFSFNEKWKKI